MRVKQQFKDFTAWWWQGLLLLLPERWLTRLRYNPDTVTVEQRDNTFIFKHHDGNTGQLREERTVPLDDEPGKTAVNHWLNRHENPPHLTLLLPPDKQLQKPLTYPLSSEKELRAILAFEMDKQTPFADDNVYFDYVITQRDTTNNRLHIVLYVVLRDVLQKYLDVLRFLDLQPATATPGPGEMMGDINFMPAPDSKGNGASGRRLTRLAWVTVTLFMLSLYGPLLRHGAIIEQFEQQVEQSRTQAMQAQALINKKQAILARVDFLSNQYRRHIPPIRLLQELTRRLPDNTWIDRLVIQDGEIQAHGESETAAAVIQLMEESDYFEQAQFRSPVTKNNATGNDQFHVAASISMEAMK